MQEEGLTECTARSASTEVFTHHPLVSFFSPPPLAQEGCVGSDQGKYEVSARLMESQTNREKLHTLTFNGKAMLMGAKSHLKL